MIDFSCTSASLLFVLARGRNKVYDIEYNSQFKHRMSNKVKQKSRDYTNRISESIRDLCLCSKLNYQNGFIWPA